MGKTPVAVVDNCGCHHVQEIEEAFVAAGWKLLFLPPNMTSELQPMDLVVNGPLKQFLRRMRITASLTYFTVFKLAVWKAKAEHQQLPMFKAPVPKMKDGVAAVFEAYDTVLSTPKMAKSLARCFQKVGLALTPSTAEHDEYFVQYQLASRHGVAITASAIIREPTDLEGLSLASTLCPVESRCGAESDHDTEEGEEDEGEESEGDSDFMNDVLEYGGRDEDGNVL